MAVVVDLLAAAATSVGAVSTEEVSVVVSAAVALVLAVFVAAVWLPNPLEAEPGAAVVALALALPVLAAFAQPRICMGALILPVEVSADQPVRSDTTTEAAGTSAARTYQFSGRGNQSMRSYAGRNATVARQQNRSASLTRQNMRTSNAQSSAAVRRAMANHRVFARHDGNWHHDWDRHHAHFDHGHVFVFTDGFWWGLYPWDYYPYDAYGSYPSDYNDYPYGYNDYPYDSSDSYTQNPYSYYDGYAAPAQSGNAVVSSVQSQLAKLGYYHGAVDGVAGDETQAAIARYQEDNDLSVTGTFTAATLQSLGLAGR